MGPKGMKSPHRFGTWANRAVDTIYQESTDGYVCALTPAVGADVIILEFLTDGATPPTTKRTGGIGGNYNENSWVVGFVRKNDYWKIIKTGTGAPVVYWLPDA